jgi:RimJ/RimL family protein N-acetyltransferase
MIRGNGFVLRTVREADLDAVYDFLSDIEIRGDYVMPRVQSQPAFRKLFQETGFCAPDEGWLLIVDAEDDRILGQIGWFRPVFYTDGLEIGYHVFDVARRNKGLMTEVLRLFSSYLFSHRSLYRLQLAVTVGNRPSRRVAEKAGFRSEGILRGAAFLKGAHHDLEIFSLLRDEWQPVPPFLPLSSSASSTSIRAPSRPMSGSASGATACAASPSRFREAIGARSS